MKILPAFVLSWSALTLLSPQALAQRTICVSSTASAESFPAQLHVEVAQLDPLLAPRLDGISVTLSGGWSGDIGVENLSDLPLFDAKYPEAKYTLELSGPGGMGIGTLTDTFDEEVDGLLLRAFDGTLDFGGHSGRTLFEDGAGSRTFSMAFFEEFVGYGRASFVADLSFDASFDSSETPQLAALAAARPQTVVLEVCYHLTEPDCSTANQGDCNGNGVADACDVLAGVGSDCNANGLLDACESDCDQDGLPDPCEVDLNLDGYPDDCQELDGLDCNGNGIPDFLEVASGANDVNGDGIPDECQCQISRYGWAGWNTDGTRGVLEVEPVGTSLVLRVSRCKSDAMGMFVAGTTDDFAALDRGQLCIGDPLVRLAATRLASDGSGLEVVDLEEHPQLLRDVAAGAPLQLQFWYRDGGRSNLTSAARVELCLEGS